MIKETEVPEILGNELPEINYELQKKVNTKNIYKTIQCFADFTKQLAVCGNLKEVQRCFNLAEKMLQDGNNTVKNAIENVYLFSVSKILDMTNPLSEAVKEMLNGPLRNEYYKQVHAGGIWS